MCIAINGLHLLTEYLLYNVHLYTSLKNTKINSEWTLQSLMQHMFLYSITDLKCLPCYPMVNVHLLFYVEK